MIELQVLGTGDAFSTRRFGASFFVVSGEHHLLVDGPPGLFRLLEIRKKIRLIHLPDGFQSRSLPLAREGETVIVTDKGLAIRAPDP